MAEKKGVIVAGKDARKRLSGEIKPKDAKDPGDTKSPTKTAKLPAAN
ncbi:hypothetical protein [Sinorhizobium sp. RAC02]|nr:hypothetical protein [Sinorhizobium sp. RAC02]AOF93058.1 hypothetical protein BSY16_4699 [Sinorhizobium sp. RAC02]